MSLDGVDERGGDERGCFIPGNPHKAALSSCLLVLFTLLPVFDDASPGRHRIVLSLQRIPPHLDERGTGIGVFQAYGAVCIPRVARASRTPTGFVIGRFRPAGGVVHLLGIPDNDPSLHVYIP